MVLSEILTNLYIIQICLQLVFLRAFNLEGDEHPVKYVVEKLSETIYEPILSWLNQDILNTR